MNALKTMGNQNAVLLANHGMNVVCPDLPKAFAIAEQLEFCAELYVRARTIDKPVILPDDEMDQMVERFMRAGY